MQKDVRRVSVMQKVKFYNHNMASGVTPVQSHNGTGRGGERKRENKRGSSVSRQVVEIKRFTTGNTTLHQWTLKVGESREMEN